MVSLMKYTIKNPLNSPYPITSEKGQEIVPARGEITSDFTEIQIQPIKAVGYFEVTESTGKREVEDVEEPDDRVEQPRPRGRPRKDA